MCSSTSRRGCRRRRAVCPACERPVRRPVPECNAMTDLTDDEIDVIQTAAEDSIEARGYDDAEEERIQTLHSVVRKMQRERELRRAVGIQARPLPASISYVSFVLYGRPVSDDSFAGRVMELFPKADAINLRRLRVGFPWEYLAWASWMSSGDGIGWEDDFWSKLADRIPPDPEVVV